MNEQVEKLVAALASGEYKQGQRQLHLNNGSYCCLGVACEIAPIGEWVKEDYGFSYAIPLSSGETSSYLGHRTVEGFHLPSKVKEYYQFRDAHGSFRASLEWLDTLSEEDRLRFDTIKAAVMQTEDGKENNPIISLAGMNDADIDFKEIAWVIQLNPPGLFMEEYYEPER